MAENFIAINTVCLTEVRDPLLTSMYLEIIYNLLLWSIVNVILKTKMLMKLKKQNKLCSKLITDLLYSYGSLERVQGPPPPRPKFIHGQILDSTSKRSKI